MHRTRTVLAAVLGALLAAAVPAAPALASVTQPYSHAWTTARCAQGAITDYQVTADGAVTVSGWIQPCPDTPTGHQFGIMYYAEYGRLATGLRAYKPASGATPFAEYASGPVNALCLEYDYERRLSCVAVRTVDGRVTAVEPIATDHPLVRIAVERLPGDASEVNPVCATCL